MHTDLSRHEAMGFLLSVTSEFGDPQKVPAFLPILRLGFADFSIVFRRVNGVGPELPLKLSARNDGPKGLASFLFEIPRSRFPVCEKSP